LNILISSSCHADPQAFEANLAFCSVKHKTDRDALASPFPLCLVN